MHSTHDVDEGDKTITILTEGKVLQITTTMSKLITSNQSNPKFLKFPIQKNVLKFKEVSDFSVKLDKR